MFACMHGCVHQMHVCFFLFVFVCVYVSSHVVHVYVTGVSNWVVCQCVICDRLCENWTCRGINKNEIYPKIGGKRKFMDLLIMNSPVSLDIVLSIR